MHYPLLKLALFGYPNKFSGDNLFTMKVFSCHRNLGVWFLPLGIFWFLWFGKIVYFTYEMIYLYSKEMTWSLNMVCVSKHLIVLSIYHTIWTSWVNETDETDTTLIIIFIFSFRVKFTVNFICTSIKISNSRWISMKFKWLDLSFQKFWHVHICLSGLL